MTPRIVSLLPSATEIVCALGLGPFLVGRSHECDFPPEVLSLPVCTGSEIDSEGTSAEIHAAVTSLHQHRISVYDVHEALLRELRPTHIVTQVQCEVCAVSVHDVHRTLEGWEEPVEVLSLRATTLQEVFADFQCVADRFGCSGQAQKLIARLRERMDEISRALPSHERIPLIGLEWLDPLMGTGNWMPELISIAGGLDLYSTAGEHARWLSSDTLASLKPDLLVLFPCGFSIEKTERELAGLAGWPAGPADVFSADGNHFFNRPGPRLLETLEILAEILHPEQFDFGHRGKNWKRWEPPHSDLG